MFYIYGFDGTGSTRVQVYVDADSQPDLSAYGVEFTDTDGQRKWVPSSAACQSSPTLLKFGGKEPIKGELISRDDDGSYEDYSHESEMDGL